jgi:phosphomevalonate kinase
VRVVAPGKLVLTGAYAVLEGEPAIVVAVDRYAVAQVDAPDRVDTSALHDAEGRKLGLGSSAAYRVAAEGARAAARGEDLLDARVRDRIFRAVRDDHAQSQGGGSGVDVAASVHGGALCYRIAQGEASIVPVVLPPGVELAVFWSGSSARTSDLRARVDAMSPSTRRAAFAPLSAASRDAADALTAGDARAAHVADRARFLDAARAFGRALTALGRAADAPIVPPAFAELGALAEGEGAAFHPSGAGGGDVAVWLGSAPPSPAFVSRAEALSMRRLTLGLDCALDGALNGAGPTPGVRLEARPLAERSS